MTEKKSQYDPLENSLHSQLIGLTRPEESKLSLMLSQRAEELFGDEANNKLLSETSFLSTIRETDSTGLIQQIEDRLSRKLTYQDIAGISLSGTDMVKTLDCSHLRDSNGSRRFSALARVYIEKTIEKISSIHIAGSDLHGGKNNTDKQSTRKLVNSYKKNISGSHKNPSLEQAITNYNNWIEENKKSLPVSEEFLHDVQIRVDDVFHKKNTDFEDNNLVQDIAAFGGMRQAVVENMVEQDMRSEGLKMSKKIRISDLLIDEYHTFEESIDQADNIKREEMANTEKTKKFLSYLHSKAMSADDIATVNALEDMNQYQNDLTKCSEQTQTWFLEKQKDAWEKTAGYNAISSMLQKFVSINKEDVDKITHAILAKPDGRGSKIECIIDGKPTTISITTKLREGSRDAGESYIESRDVPAPLDITINGKDTISLSDVCPLQNAVVLSTMIAHGDSLPEEEKNKLLEEVNQELRPQNQKASKLTSSLIAPTKHTFSVAEVLSNLLASDDEKLLIAQKLCGMQFSTVQKEAIIASHNVGSYKKKEDAPEHLRDTLTLHDGERFEVGKDEKTYARGWNYSQSQLKKKMEILTKAGLSMQQATMLIRAGITGKINNEEEIKFTKEDIENLEKEIEGINARIGEAKEKGALEGKAPVNLEQIKKDLRDVAREIDQLEKERANFKVEAAKAGVAPADKIHYETEAQRLANEIKVLGDRQAALQEQVDPINAYILKEGKTVDSKYAKLEEKKAILKQLEKRQENDDVYKKIDTRGSDDSESSINDLKEVWGNIKGEKNIEPKVGTSLFLREGIFENYFPKGLNAEVGNWIELRVKDIDPNTGALTFSIHGVFKPLYDKEGKTKREGTVLPPFTPNELKEKITQSNFDEVYKLKSITSVKEWGEHMKNADIDFAGIAGGGDNKHQAWLQDMRAQVDFSSMKKIKMENTSETEEGKDVQYFGADSEYFNEKSGGYDPYRLWYKLTKASGNEIILEEGGADKEGGTIKHSFTPQGFFFFAAENKLRPYTQGEVDVINKNSLENDAPGQEYINDGMWSPHNSPSDLMRRTAEGRGLFGLKRGSIKSIIASFKKIKKEGIDKWLDERSKKNEELVWNTMMTSGAVKWLGGANIPGVSEITGMLSSDIENKLDTEKTNKIKEAKEEPSKAGNSGPFGPQIFIGKSFFNDDPFKGNSIGSGQFIYAQMNPLKVAGYFLYCCENGGPYAKALAAYDNTGSWVKLLLGEKFQQQYLRERAELKKEIESLPHDSAERIGKQDLYAKQDLGFLQSFGLAQKLDSPWKKSIYGEAFFSKMLGGAELAWNSKKTIQAAESDISDANLFDSLKTNYYAHLQSGRGASSTGALGKMAAKVQNNERYYYDWAGAMLFNILSGSIKHNFVEDGKEWYAALSRKYAFVPGLYAMDGDGSQQLIRLMDIVAKDLGATTLSDYVKNTDKGPIKFKVGDINATKNNAAILQDWIHLSESRRVIDALLSPEKLLKIMEKERPGGGEPIPGQPGLNNYNVVKDYLENKFMDKEQSSMGNMDDVKRSLIFMKHIWSFSPALVKRLMGATNNHSSFPTATADIGPLLWRKLGTGIEDILRGNFTQQKFQFLLKRFAQYFDESFDMESQRLLIVGIRERNAGVIQTAISGSFDRKGLSSNLHPDIFRTLKLFEKAFLRGGAMYESGDNRRLDAFVGEESWSDAKSQYKNTTVERATEMVKKKRKNKNTQDLLQNLLDE